MDPIRIAVDVMGGDYGTPVLIDGVITALAHTGKPVTAFLCGNKSRIAQALDTYDASKAPIVRRCIIEDCPEEINPQDSPARVWKQKSKASIVRCITLQHEGAVDASVSAGDTGILMSAALFILGRQETVSRPALAAVLPTLAAQPCVLIDVGANVTSRGSHLAEFARMAQAYYRDFFEVAHPGVALLNIGQEPLKGTRTLTQANTLLQKEIPGYQGYIEANRVLSGDVHIIVSNGFIGNIVLKAYESFYAIVRSLLHEQQKETSRELMQRMHAFNPERYGAVPLLGIHGLVFKAHGSSSATAFTNAVHTVVSHVAHLRDRASSST
jgi:glycerol-3-phosphate acyltransferase PlsX